jgi:hypothetical protein
MTINISNASTININGGNVNGGGAGGPGGGAGGSMVDPNDLMPQMDPGFANRSFMNAAQAKISQFTGSRGLATIAGLAMSNLLPAAVQTFGLPGLVLSLMDGQTGALDAQQAVQQQIRGIGSDISLAQTSGQFAGLADYQRLMNAETDYRTGRSGFYGFMDGSGFGKVANFLTLGGFDRKRRLEDETIEFAVKTREFEEKGIFLEAVGISSDLQDRSSAARRLSVKYGFGDQRGLNEANKMLMGDYQNAFKYSFAQSGLYGLADLDDFSGLGIGNPNSSNNRLMAQAAARASRFLPIEQRIQASISGRGQFDFSAFGGASLSSILTGDSSPDMVALSNKFNGRNATNRMLETAMVLEYTSSLVSSGQQYSAANLLLGQTLGVGLTEQNALMAQAAESTSKIANVARIRADKAREIGAPLDVQARLNAEALSAQSGYASSLMRSRRFIGDSSLQISGIRSSAAMGSQQLALFGGAYLDSNNLSGDFAATLDEIRRRSSILNERLNNSSFYGVGPIEQEQIRAELIQNNLQSVAINRQYSQTQFSQDMSFVGLRGSERMANVSRAELFGGVSDIYSARNASTQTISEEIQVTRANLERLKRIGSTLEERNEIMSRLKTLETDLEKATEMNRRSYYDMSVSNSLTLSGTTRTLGALQAIRGGSLAAAPLRASSISNVREAIAYQKQLVESLPEGSIARNEAESKLAQLQLSETNSEISMADYSPSPSLSRDVLRNQLRRSIATRTFAGYGDVRASIQEGIALTGRQLDELRKNYDLAMENASPENREAITLRFEQQQSGLIEQAIGLQQQLESGWQERLLSQTINSSGNFNMVASRFTRRESALSGVLNRAFGGNKDQRDYFMNQGKAFMGMFGINGSSSMFTNAALGGAQVQLTGGLEIIVNVQDGVGNTIARQTQTLNAGQQVQAVMKPQPIGL